MAREHDQSFCAPLTEHERAQLGELLQKLAAAQGLRAHVHPGYRKLDPPPGTRRGRGKS